MMLNSVLWCIGFFTVYYNNFKRHSLKKNLHRNNLYFIIYYKVHDLLNNTQDSLCNKCNICKIKKCEEKIIKVSLNGKTIFHVKYHYRDEVK